MKKITLLFCCATILWQCKNKLEEPETELRSDVAVEMSFIKTETSFRDGNENLADGLIDTRTIPVVNKEKINLKILHNGASELYIEDLEHDENLIISNEVIINDVPEPKYYKILNGIYSVYDKAHQLIFSQHLPTVDYTKALEQIIRNRSTAQNLLGGGVLLFDLKAAANENNTNDNPALKVEGDPLHNQFDDNPDYDVIRETKLNELDGLFYTQETIVNNNNNTLVWISLYDHEYSMVSRTSFGYQETQNGPQLVHTQDIVYEETKDGFLKHITLTEYEDFTVSLNL